jgi:hypothetical protein
MKTWLDVSVLRCPNCGRHYVEASWYVVEMEADIECGDRVLLEFDIGEDGKLQKVDITKHLGIEKGK